MTFRQLIEKLNKLNESKLDQEVIFANNIGLSTVDDINPEVEEPVLWGEEVRDYEVLV